MRWIYITVAILFALFAWFQLNDPDPIAWVGAYLFAVLVTIPPIFDKHTPLPAFGMIGYLIWFFILSPSIDESWWEKEVAREAFGLLLCALWMGILFYLWVRRRGSVDEDPSP